MGSCCFTPTKRDFLWWYWLFLLSIVGIPMLLAVWYVSQGSNLDEQDKLRRGKVAARIFWLGTLVVGFSTFFIVDAILKAFYSDPSDTSYWGIGYSVFAHRAGWIMLAIQFCIATVAANGANNLVRKRPLYQRIPLLVVCLGAYWLAASVIVPFTRPAIHFMQFLVCMLPAHWWGVFKDTPDTGRAWRAFWAFFAAAALFFLVSYFGEDFAQLIHGTPQPWWR
jgi:uncharacterized membrane protein